MAAEAPQFERRDSTPPERDAPLERGDEVGEYRIVRVLGSGGFGTVYEAVQPKIDKHVAIKLLSRKHSSDSEAVARFVDEARLANGIGHRNIVGTFSFGELADGRCYHVMDYVDGEALDAMIAREGKVSIPDCVQLLRGVAGALDAAHERGIVHRDLKPANVLVGREDDVAVARIIDFGIAKLLGEDAPRERTESGAILGTPEYMAPEQCRGRGVDARTDVYAFGVLAYELLTGQRPFAGEDRVDLFLKITSRAPQPPSELRPELPRAVDALVLGLLEKDPAARPERLSDVARALGDVLRDVPAESAKARVWPWLLAAAAVAVVGALMLRPPSRAAVAASSVAIPVAPPVASHAAPAPAPLPATAPTRVKVEIQGGPSGAEVLGPDGRSLGSVPGVIELPGAEAVTLTFRKKGFVSQKRELHPREERTLTVTLTKAPPRAQPGPDDPEDPFQ